MRTRTNRLLLGAVGALALLAICALVWVAATAARLQLPAPTGPYAVGRLRMHWVDEARPEQLQPDGQREVIAEVWYPAQPQTGQQCPYFPELPKIAGAMIESGLLSRLEASGLAWIRAHARSGASFAQIDAPCPVILFSPGNSTNVEFYAVYGEELASRGFVVFGVNHPYDVGGVRLESGSVATYRERPAQDRAALAARMATRAADMRFLVDCLADVNQGDGPLAGHLDLTKIGSMGHSLGGMTAAEACSADARFAACINIDGLHAGNPYGAQPEATAPQQPFLYIGKQRTIGPNTEKLIASNPAASLASVADARHMDFADVNLFVPAINPFQNSVQRVLNESRQKTVEFFEKWLR